MGIFNRSRRPSRSKVAEGGEGLLGDTGSRSTGAGAGAGSDTKQDLSLFGADSDESDDDATIERYAGGASAKDDGDDGDGAGADDESRKVSTLLSKLSPEELFRRYDADGSGAISANEFLAMVRRTRLTLQGELHSKTVAAVFFGCL
ncbi:hypothetical protein PINS_up016563 [Pythium insidiosum]|nr:hypothetical protein PINS_up016563 [Pythium insidiosum]